MDFPKNEKEILKFWQKNKIFEKLRKKNKGKKRFSFLDGPITANNPMGVHHAWGRTYKDVFQRYKAMQGFDERYQNGFDCQGLWVEVEVEKEKGFKNKKDIERYGIAKFVNDCKKRVLKYSKIQTRQSIRLGQWMDWDNSYYTMSDENNYAIWGFLKKCFQKGLLYKGRDVVPWCFRCGTAISQHEILTEEYKEIVHKSVFLKIPIVDRQNTFFLVWTTTPWTLPANIALAVNPDLNYVEVEDENKNIFILLENKVNLIPNAKIIKKFLGKELNNLEYKGIFDELDAVKEALSAKYNHKIVLWKDVSEEEGTGIVHIAPGCGQEDFKLSKELNLPIIDPLDDDSRYKNGFGFLEGREVKGINDLIFDSLKEKNLIFKIEDYKHRYPTCWRCKEELIFRLVDEWYISMDKLRNRLMEIVKTIKWIPDFGLDRELDWLKNMDDWLISKKRYWGLVLPIFECECGNFEVIGSKEELKKRAVEGWDKFEGHSPHRPWIDYIKIKCRKCKKLISRIKDVGNPWLDAGIVPFSTMGYFKDKNYWRKWFPADLVCESFPGQFKNWFYSLIVMSAVLEDEKPVETIFGYASVRDEKGEEMHKSKGNAIWFDEAVEKIGADLMRWMYMRQNPAYNLNFGYKTAEEIKRKILILYNSYLFFTTYAAKDEVRLSEIEKLRIKSKLNKWVISRLNSLIKEVVSNLDNYDVAYSVLAIEKFFIDDLSLWYIRRSREKFHIFNEERKEAVKTLYYVLLTLLKIIAPIMPFFAEKMYFSLKLKKMPQSIHLFDYPKPLTNLIDKELEEKMQEARDIVALALSERVKNGIKIRQPLLELKIKNQKLKSEEEILELIKEEVNVKNIIFDDKIEKAIELNINITEGLKKEGDRRELIRHIRDLRKKLNLKSGNIVSAIVSNIDVLPMDEKEFLKEAGAKSFCYFKDKKDVKADMIKNIKIDEKEYFIGIKK